MPALRQCSLKFRNRLLLSHLFSHSDEVFYFLIDGRANTTDLEDFFREAEGALFCAVEDDGLSQAWAHPGEGLQEPRIGMLHTIALSPSGLR